MSVGKRPFSEMFGDAGTGAVVREAAPLAFFQRGQEGKNTLSF